MGKKYKHADEKPEKNRVREPMLEYGLQEEMKFSPPLTEEELKNAITGDELLESAYKFIDELFDKDEDSIH